MRCIARTYGGMLSGQYRTHAGTLVEPPMSQEFVHERIHKAAAAIFYEAVRQRLWLRGPEERKSPESLLSYLSIAEEADHVEYKLMTDETKALLSLRSSAIHHAEHQPLRLIAEVPWLYSEIDGVIASSWVSPVAERIVAKRAELRAELYPRARPPPVTEREAEGAQADGGPALPGEGAPTL